MLTINITDEAIIQKITELCRLNDITIEDSSLNVGAAADPNAAANLLLKDVCSITDTPYKEGLTSKTVNYVVSVPADKCIIRKGPDAIFAEVRPCPKGAFTIVEESNTGWGKLKSGEGWIELAPTTKKEVAPPKPKTGIERFCEKLYEIAPVIEQTMVYSNSDGECQTWADALKYKKCNCAKYISYAAQLAEIVPNDLTFYWYHTKTIKPAKAKEFFLNSKDWEVFYPNRKMKLSEFKVGDIIGIHTTTSQHTTAICGVDKDGKFIWASAGSADMRDKKLIGRNDYTNKVINCVIRYIGK